MAASLRPRRGFLFPGLLIVTGVTLLIAMLGGLPEGYWGALLPLWPVAFVAVGLSLLLSRIRPWIGSTVGLGLIAGALVAAWPLAAFDYFEEHFGLAATTVHEFSVDRENATSARVELEIGAAELDLQAGASPDVLTSGTFKSCGVDSLQVDVRRADDRLTARLAAEDGPRLFQCSHATWGPADEWVVALSPRIPTVLEITGGLWDADLNLEDLQITRLDVETGASETRVTLPRTPGHMSANFDMGAGTLEIYVPQEVAIRLDLEGGALSFDIDDDRFGRRRRGATVGFGFDEVYVSPDFATAENRVDIKIRAGASEISVKSIP